ncbi:hypothetical protein [Fundidesulfovibrio soli]|uniref:hypothetical protein n=1 Tax=Fundidesulfovibrio soli TaxID=2922716 RepID=UPI001FAFEF55|nr:hypothetical protein [Fundidesulfovibrio soli]
MRIDAARVVKLGLFLCLALTFYKGFMKLPEVYPVLEPERFYRGLINDGENSLIMKERHFDFNNQTGLAVAMRIKELNERGETPPDTQLVTRERAGLALGKCLAKDARNADYVLLAKEKLERAKRLKAENWSMGWSLGGVDYPRFDQLGAEAGRP